MQPFEFAELIATRFSHDITGPLGAIHNGVELVEEDPSMVQDAMQLIASSAREAVARVQFFRFAYGVAMTRGEADLSQLQTLAQGYYRTTHTRLEWQVPANITLPAVQGKLISNMLIAMQGALMRGGVLRVMADETGIQVTAEGPTIRMPEDAPRLLTRPASEELSPKTVQYAYTALLARQSGLQLVFESEETQVRLRAEQA